MIAIDRVSMVFPDRDRRTVALDEVSLRVGEGEFVAILGPSGCGKSTLLELVAGLSGSTGGSLLVDGRPVTEPGPERGMVFQDYSLFPWMTAQENLEFAIEQTNGHHSREENRKKAEEYLGAVGLKAWAQTYPQRLSGGMRQRLAIARMFAIGSKIFLMDEPFGALDSLNRAYMQDLLLGLWKRGETDRTVLFVTHDVDEATLLSDRIVVMTPSPGRIRETIDVPFGRPREREHLNSDERYLELRARLLRLLYDELVDSLGGRTRLRAELA